MIKQIKETCLYISNIERTKAFYHGILGLEIIAISKDRHIFFRVGPDVLLCFLAEATRNDEVLPPHFANGHQHVAFEAEKERYEQVKEELQKKGIVITHVQNWGKQQESFYFKDPDNHVLEIVMEGLWSA